MVLLGFRGLRSVASAYGWLGVVSRPPSQDWQGLNRQLKSHSIARPTDALCRFRLRYLARRPSFLPSFLLYRGKSQKAMKQEKRTETEHVSTEGSSESESSLQMQIVLRLSLLYSNV